MLNLNTRMLLYSSVMNALRGFTQNKQSMFILKKKYTIAFFVILHSIKRRTRLPTYLIFMVKAMFGKLEEIKTFECWVCDAAFKYKKDLTVHTRLKHVSKQTFRRFIVTNVIKSFYKKMKDTNNVFEFPCPSCGKNL